MTKQKHRVRKCTPQEVVDFLFNNDIGPIIKELDTIRVSMDYVKSNRRGLTTPLMNTALAYSELINKRLEERKQQV